MCGAQFKLEPWLAGIGVLNLSFTLLPQLEMALWELFFVLLWNLLYPHLPLPDNLSVRRELPVHICLTGTSPGTVYHEIRLLGTLTT